MRHASRVQQIRPDLTERFAADDDAGRPACFLLLLLLPPPQIDRRAQRSRECPVTGPLIRILGGGE